MNYNITYKQGVEEHIRFYKRSGQKSLYEKLVCLLNEIQEHPRTGTGKPERLKFKDIEIWSRRISGEHRLVYSIDENIITVEVISAKGHYGDK